MENTLPSKLKLFGLVELNPIGKVLYAKFEDGERMKEFEAAIEGRDFFSEVAPFKNADELRARFRRFAATEAPADSFNFTCRYADSFVPVRVLLARIRERNDHERTKSILVYIKRAQ